MTVTTYDPAEISIIFGGVPIDGFADGTFVSVEWNEDFYNLTIGSGGEGCRARSNDNSGRVTLTLLQSSASNDALSAILNTDLLSPGGDGILPLLVKDNTGRTLVSAEKAWIVKPANVSYGREVENREWTLESEKMVPVNIGGNN